MSTLRREHFGKLLEPGLRKVFYDTYKQFPSMISDLFNVQKTSNPYEEDLSIGTLGDFPMFTGSVSYDRLHQGYSKLYEFPEFAKGFSVERKMFDDDRYNIINKRPAGLAISANRRRETDAAFIFNNAFASSGVNLDGVTIDTTGSDGKPMCADDHTSTAPDGPTARSNRGTLPLSHASLQTARNAMRATLDDRGGKISVTADTLLVPVALEETAWSLIEAAGVVDTNTHNPNIHQGKYKLIVWDYLTDDNNWFLIDSNYSKLYLNWFDRVPLEFEMEEEFDTLVSKYRAYTRYSAGFSDWIWVYGSNPA